MLATQARSAVKYNVMVLIIEFLLVCMTACVRICVCMCACVSSTAYAQVRHLPTSVKIWLQAAELETNEAQKKVPASAILSTVPSYPLGLAWLGLAWLGLAWLGLAWLGLAWLGLAWLTELLCCFWVAA